VISTELCIYFRHLFRPRAAGDFRFLLHQVCEAAGRAEAAGNPPTGHEAERVHVGVDHLHGGAPEAQPSGRQGIETARRRSGDCEHVGNVEGLLDTAGSGSVD
jgi:hypothetical protein